MSILRDICEALRNQRYRITDHGSEEMVEDLLLENDVIGATIGGEVIEHYPKAFPLPACLVFGKLQDGAPIHMVWAFDNINCYAVMVTVYRPDPRRWSTDFRKRVEQ